MEKIKEFFNKIFSNELAKKLIIILGVFILIVIFIIILASCTRNRHLTYNQLENRMVEMAKSKYQNSKDLPELNKSIKVSLESFVNDGRIKEISTIVENNSNCTGYVKIVNNNGYYLYIPYLDCGKDYQTKSIYDILTDEKNIVTSGNGLYHVNDEYIFKGETVNNYLSLGNITYRIVNINKDGTIRVLNMTKYEDIIWDDRYNVDRDENEGINNYIANNINSRIKDSVESIYKSQSNNQKAYFVSQPLCIGKRSLTDNIFDKSIECSTSAENYPFSLLIASDFFNATLDENCLTFESESCSNYNYLTSIGATWTITADKDSTHKAYKVTAFSGIQLSNTSTTSNIKIVTNLNKELLITGGDGSQSNPYVIKEYK